MNSSQHYKNLEEMYLQAKVQQMYPGISIEVKKEYACIKLPISDQYFHAGMAVHGSVYFRLLDDAAYFSVMSTQTDNFILTASFHIELLRPVTSGILVAEGKILNRTSRIFTASSKITNDRGKLVALGKGTFMKSELPLDQISTYGNS